METFREVVGHHADEALHDRLHRIERAGGVVRLSVATRDLGRRRFRVTGSDGKDYGIALSRDEQLRSGTVLYIDESRAVVVEADEGEKLVFQAETLEGGIQLGWHAGHLHWRVRMEGSQMTVLLDAPAEDYLARIRGWVADGHIRVVP